MHLYLHVPFCKQACHYCDFHFSTNISRKKEMVETICKELSIQKEYLPTKKLTSIYFGGGTPSLLDKVDLALIFEVIHREFTLINNCEITLEANPDDITKDKLSDWHATGVNRLSIGIQSFDDEQLNFLNRAHNSKESERCIHEARDHGFDNLSIDLIYAIHSESNQIWKENIEKTIELNLPHISAYCLTIEPRTVFGHLNSKSKLQDVNDEFAAKQFEMMLSAFRQNGYEQYEISNFAKNEMYARHNTSYWKGDPYLGIGPSAHSFNGESRQWNVSNNAKYLKSLNISEVPFELEILSKTDKVNELLLTGLRTKWGVAVNDLIAQDNEFYITRKEIIDSYIEREKLIYEEGRLILTESGRLFADGIASDLFME